VTPEGNQNIMFCHSIPLVQGAGRKVVAHLVQASEIVANLIKWRTRRDFLKRVYELLPGKWGSLLF
jgi:hypothetical protein